MDIKQILKEKIEGGKKDLALLAEDSENALANETKITLLRGEISAYCDCLTLIEQAEKPMKVTQWTKGYITEPICPRCGKPTSISKFCRECGQPLDLGEGEKK